MDTCINLRACISTLMSREEGSTRHPVQLSSFTLHIHDKTTSHCNLSIETDSDWASDHTDRKSFSGSCVFYIQRLPPQLSRLQSRRKQATVSTSSTEAEYIALSELRGCQGGAVLVNLIDDISPVKLPVKTYIDNIGAGFIAQND
eukprot:3278237-Pyramimonas_sp.AAC.1